MTIIIPYTKDIENLQDYKRKDMKPVALYMKEVLTFFI
jgi:hypothetical protein